MTSAFDLLEHVPVPAYVFRAEGEDFVLERVNAVGLALNPTLAVLLGKPMAGLYRDQPQVIEDATRAVREQVTVVREVAMRRHDRTEATNRLRLSYVPAPPSHLVIYVQDIGTEETATAALRESEARYRSVVASLPDGFLLRGVDGRVLACNDVAVRLFGRQTQADLIGAHRVLPPDFRVTTEAGEPVGEEDYPSRRVVSTGKGEIGKVYALLGPAPPRWLRVSSEPVFSGTGAVTGSVTTYSDITERVLAQRALRDALARLDLALAAAKMGVWEYDPEADTGWWSDNLDAIFALASRPPTLVDFARCVDPEDQPHFVASAARITQTPHGSTFEEEFRITGSDAVTRWARIRGQVSREDGRVRLVGTVMDVTEHHHLEEELRRAHRLESIGRLAGGIAHDFNNLLAAMMGSLELVERQIPKAAAEDLATVQHATRRARDLTKQLLAFARKQPVEFKKVNLTELVTSVERLLRRLVGPNIEIRIHVSGPVWVHADASQLEQVLVNLVVNARDAMPTGGTLEVRVAELDVPGSDEAAETAALEVTDSGVGMDDATRRQIFDPFFTTKSHGTGLGLASSYGIAKQHGGDIVVESEPGRGTCFRVLLPRATAGTEVAEEPANAPPTHTPVKACVLVVDDEAMVRQTTVRLLESLGYEVLSAGNAEEAAQRSREHAGRIDVLLCDIAMPGRGGASVAAELTRARPALRVLFASGYADAEETRDVHGAAFLQKPYTLAELSLKLAELLAV